MTRSGKQKKQYLKAKKQQKKERKVRHEAQQHERDTRLWDGDDQPMVFTTALSKTGKVNKLTTSFLKDTDFDVQQRKEHSTEPLNLNGRSSPLLAPLFPDVGFPIRPTWKSSESKQTIESRETHAFQRWLDWLHKQIQAKIAAVNRQGTAKERLQVGDVVSPFEHNVEVWRQFWRVVERSDMIVLCADVRCALLHIPESLYRYICEALNKPLVIVLTKVDLVAQTFVERWKRFLKENFPKAHVTEFASKASSTNGTGGVASRRKTITSKATKKDVAALKANGDWLLQRCTQIYLEFLASSPDHIAKHYSASNTKPPYVPTIGLIGQPNVGKSSLLNCLVGKHVVSVSRTCGHTKHLQTYLTRRDLAKSSDQYTTMQQLRSIVPSAAVDTPGADQGDRPVDKLAPQHSDESAPPTQIVEGVVVAELCDCPGLIFPVLSLDSLTTTTTNAQQQGNRKPTISPRALFECNGLYPIPQVREPFSAIRLIAEHIELERVYNLKLDMDDYGESWSPYAICGALADKKGYTISKGSGAPDMHRAGLEILRDTVDGYVLLSFDPPQGLTDRQDAAGLLFGEVFDWDAGLQSSNADGTDVLDSVKASDEQESTTDDKGIEQGIGESGAGQGIGESGTDAPRSDAVQVAANDIASLDVASDSIVDDDV